VTDPALLVDFANRRDGSTWSLVGRMPGGWNRGAFELRDRQGARAVLKWHPPAQANHELAATQAMLDAAREAGWDSPRWLAIGQTEEGVQFLLEELVAARPARPDARDLSAVLAANRLQAGRGGGVARDWARYNWRVLFEGEGGYAEVLRGRPDSAALLDRILAANDPAQILPNDDLVHGDCTLDNVLIRDERPVFIDAEHAGRGTRAYDLATLVYEANLGGGEDRPTPPEETTERIIAEADRIVGRAGLLQCVTASMIEFIAFGFDHWPDNVAVHMTRCQAFLDRLGVARLG